MISFIKQLWEHRQFITGILFMLFLILFLRQCDKTKEVENELNDAKNISQQNIQALANSEIQLRLTLNELKIVDSSLFSAIKKIDSLEKIKTKTITVIKPIYVEKEVIIPNEIVYDTIKQNYGLTFTTKDQIRSFSGTSWFGIKDDSTKLLVIPKYTQINDFKLNFALVVSQYIDTINNYTRTKISPFELLENGSLGQRIPENILSISFRNAEILDKPNVPNNPTTPTTENKKWYTSGFGISFSPIALGIYPGLDGKYRVGWTPSIGLSYNIVFNKKT